MHRSYRQSILTARNVFRKERTRWTKWRNFHISQRCDSYEPKRSIPFSISVEIIVITHTYLATHFLASISSWCLLLYSSCSRTRQKSCHKLRFKSGSACTRSDRRIYWENRAEIFHQTLAELGVKCVFGYPGGAILPIFDAIYESKHFDFTLTRHEQGAGHMAQEYARATGKPGVVVATSGPGAKKISDTVARCSNRWDSHCCV